MSRVALAALCAATLCACASTGDEAGGQGDRDSALTGRSALTRSILGAGESGLRIVHWRVDDETTAIARALSAHRDEAWPDRPVSEQLRRNGFRLVRVDLDALETLPEAFGGASLDRDGWFGQMLAWRELVGVPMDDEGRAVALSGRVHRFSGGRMRLMMRGWTMPMEDGPVVYLQLLPEYEQSGPTRLDHVLSRRPFVGERYTEIGVDLMLEVGHAYVLTCETPGVLWGDEPVVGETARPRMTGPGAVGPRIDVPPAIGELLLRPSATIPQRDLFVFVPKIPADLFPEPVSLAVTEPRGSREGAP